MATESSNLRLPSPVLGDSVASYTDGFTRLIATLDAYAALAGGVVVPTQYPSTELKVNVRPVKYRKADGSLGSYAGVTAQALTASSTNRLYLTNAGVLTIITSAYPTGSPIVHLATVTTNGTTVTAIVDDRVCIGALT